MWLCAANWGHWPAWVLGGSSAGHAVQDDGLSTKGINRLWIRSFWKVVLTRGLWDRESGPDAAGFICCQAPIIPRFLAASLGSFCYMGYFRDKAILPVSVGASLRSVNSCGCPSRRHNSEGLSAYPRYCHIIQGEGPVQSCLGATVSLHRWTGLTLVRHLFGKR